MNQNTRKTFFAALLALVMLLSCALPVLADAPAEVKIVLMHDEAEEARIKVRDEINQAFMAANPGIVVEQMPVDEDSFDTKLKTLVSSGQLPAVLTAGLTTMQMLDSEAVTDIAANKSIVDGFGRDKFYTGVLDILNSADGSGMVGVPTSGWIAGIWYRTDLFAEMGLAAPTTWDNILAAAKALSDPANKKYGILMATEEGPFTGEVFQQFAHSNGASLFDADGKPTFNSPEMKETVQFLKELYQYTLPGSNGTTQVRDALVAGNAAMGTYSTYILGALNEAGYAGKIGFTLPEKKVAAAYGSPTLYTVAADLSPEEADAAKKYIEFLLTPEINIKLLHMAPGGPQPVQRAIADDPAYLDVPILTAFGDVMKEVPTAFDSLKVFGVQDGKTNPAIGSINGAGIISRAINQILVQGADIDATMDAAQSEMEALVG